MRDNAPAQAPAAGAAGDKPAVTAVAKSDNAPALAPAPAVEDKTAAAEGSPSKPGAVTKKVFRPPWMRAAAEKASSQAPPAQEAPKPAPAEAKPEAKAAPPLKTPACSPFPSYSSVIPAWSWLLSAQDSNPN